MHLCIGGIHFARVIERDEKYAVVLHLTLEALVLLCVVH